MMTVISHRFTKRLIALVTMLLLAGGAALAAGSPARADEDMANYSFYKLSSSLAAFFSNAQSPDEDAKEMNPDVWKSVTSEPGSAGSMLGYVDAEFSFSLEFLNSQISGSSSAVGYDTLIQSTQAGDAKATKTPGMLDYVHFGATLNAMGLDSMGTGLTPNLVAPVAGSLMMLMYIFTGAVDLFFAGMIGMLKILNPFKLFYVGMQAVNPTFAEGMTGGEAAWGPFSGLGAWIGGWYGVINNMAWTVLVPLFIAVLLLGLLLSKKLDRGSAIKRLVVRLVFIGVGLPLVGSMYTGVLNSMGDTEQSGSSGSTQVVLSTYVDFENWAFKSRLYVPQSAVIEWDATKGKPTTNALTNVRNTALEINKTTNADWKAIPSNLNVGQNESWSNAAVNLDDNAGGIDGYTSTLDLLGRYIMGSKVSAASYENEVKGQFSTRAPFTNGEDGKKTVREWFTKFDDPQKDLPDIKDADVVRNNPVIRVTNGLAAHPSGATEGTKTFTTKNQWGCEAWVSETDGMPLQCNMSTLAMYNYLNSSFGSDSMTMYSSKQASSSATREMHKAVTQVGTAPTSALYWLNSFLLLGSFVVLGLAYMFSMLFSNIRRGFQLMTAIPFATIGALPGIAKVIIYSAAMVLEIVLTLFLYRFMQTFLISVPQIVEMPFLAMVKGDSLAAQLIRSNLQVSGALVMLLTVISILALVIFTVVALRVRSTVIKAVNEVVSKLVNKFLDTEVGPSAGGSALKNLAGGAAQGAGMAVANKAMGGGTAAGGSAKKPTGGSGPAGISTGGINPNGAASGSAAGGAAGALTVGGDADMNVSGSVEGDGDGDGPGSGKGGPGGPGGGNGNPGTPLALSAGGAGGTGKMGAGDARDQAVAKSVQAQGGLSEPGSRGSGDVTDTLAGSASQTQSQYAQKDKALTDGAVSGGKAVVKGAEAAGRGMAGDVGGAAAAGGAALGHAQAAQRSGQEAKSIQKGIDAPPSSSSAGASKSAAAPKPPTSTKAATSGATRGSGAAPTTSAKGKAAGSPKPNSSPRAQTGPSASGSRQARPPQKKQLPGGPPAQGAKPVTGNQEGGQRR